MSDIEPQVFLGPTRYTESAATRLNEGGVPRVTENYSGGLLRTVEPDAEE